MSTYGVIIISRDRPEMLKKTLSSWEVQKLPVTVLTEPYQAEDYERAVAGRAEVVAHSEPDRGIGYARKGAISLARSRDLDAFVMADDDTVIHKDDDVRRLLDCAARGRTVNVGGWLSVHGLWFHHVGVTGESNMLVPHFGDKLFAVNTRLADEIGFDPVPWDVDTAEWNRTCIAAGYLWWVHTGVRIKEVGKARAPGGIVGWCERTGKSRAETRRDAHEYLYEKWGSRYVSLPGRPYRTFNPRLIEDVMGRDVLRIQQDSTPFRDDDPELPCGRVGDVSEASVVQLGLFGS